LDLEMARTIFFGLVVTLLTLVEPLFGCKCLPLPAPGYCRTDFLALVKIKGKNGLLLYKLNLEISFFIKVTLAM